MWYSTTGLYTGIIRKSLGAIKRHMPAPECLSSACQCRGPGEVMPKRQHCFCCSICHVANMVFVKGIAGSAYNKADMGPPLSSFGLLDAISSASLSVLAGSVGSDTGCASLMAFATATLLSGKEA